MKKVLVAMAMMMGVGSFSAFAAETSIDSVAVSQSTQDEFTKIELTAVPAAVKTAVEAAYAGQTLKEAYVAESDGVKTYKLVLTTTEGQDSTVVFNEKGEELK